MPKPHIQKTIQINKKRFKCDIELIKLIKELNKIGLKTTQCCQGDKRKVAYISIKINPSIYDIALRDKGKRLVIWWKRKNNKLNQPIQSWT